MKRVVKCGLSTMDWGSVFPDEFLPKSFIIGSIYQELNWIRGLVSFFLRDWFQSFQKWLCKPYTTIIMLLLKYVYFIYIYTHIIYTIRNSGETNGSSDALKWESTRQHNDFHYYKRFFPNRCVKRPCPMTWKGFHIRPKLFNPECQVGPCESPSSVRGPWGLWPWTES